MKIYIIIPFGLAIMDSYLREIAYRHLINGIRAKGLEAFYINLNEYIISSYNNVEDFIPRETYNMNIEYFKNKSRLKWYMQHNHNIFILDCKKIKNLVGNIKPKISNQDIIILSIDRFSQILPTSIIAKIIKENFNPKVIVGKILYYGAFAPFDYSILKENKYINRIIWDNKDNNENLYKLLSIKNKKRQISFDNNYNAPFLTYEIAEGCNRKCYFCTNSPQRFSVKKIDTIINDIKYLKKRYKLNKVIFVNSGVNFNEEYLNELLAGFIRQKLNIIWTAYAIPANLSNQTIEKAFEAGCRFFSMGIESGNKQRLKQIGKSDLESISRIIEKSYKVGIKVQSDIIYGFPYETIEELFDTIKLIIKYKKEIWSVNLHYFEIPFSSYIFHHPERFNILIKNKYNRDSEFYEFDEIYGNNHTERRRISKIKINIIKKILEKESMDYTTDNTPFNLCFKKNYLKVLNIIK